MQLQFVDLARASYLAIAGALCRVSTAIGSIMIGTHEGGSSPKNPKNARRIFGC